MCDDRDKHFSSVHRHKTLSLSSRFVTQYSLAECAESAFSKAALSRLPARSVLLPPTVGRGRHRRPAPSRRAQNLLAGRIFDGLACQKCFCVTLDKSNRTEDEQVYEIGGITYAKNDKCNGR